MSRIELLGCPIDALTMDETLVALDQAVRENQRIRHCVVNAAKLVNLRRDETLRRAVVTSDIVNADGQAVVWAARFLGRPLPERVAGIDLMQRLMRLAHEKGYRVFFFGAEQQVVEKVVHIYAEQYSPRLIAGYRNGYFSADDAPQIARQIADSRAQILFVAISSPTKEVFLEQFDDVLDIPVIMGVGGSFDVIAGRVTRAPRWMRKVGLEWFHRMLQEPRRLCKRYADTNTRFLWYVLKEKLGW